MLVSIKSQINAVQENQSVTIITPEKESLSQTVSHINKQSVLAAILICSESGSKHLSLVYKYAVN
jgi:hypothetical protein